ncbi:hypothetical protein [Polynucleobacter bastaniensis]|jgi:hypothetical protein|uniref:hypothetical protein n=1 Tax=Polynucleobacter bastaniensis TaxID=2081039 RepID=UPI001C0E645B|nr:hypothetical protein [Polynucleobacter bastaniensis]MBU3597872.1 hypothetical protein [Polynucleobacter bastaniensis]
MSEIKKQSLVELALSLGFTIADENDPIYQNGWVITTTVGKELERLTLLEGGDHESKE